MPLVRVDTSTGPVDLHYCIATPTDHCSSTIVPGLPCILFLHSGWVGQEIFETQFSDPRLRAQFNLIGVDMRGYGLTCGSITQHNYNPADSADDIYQFIKALNLPPVHIFGLAIGGTVGLELACSHPELVLSITICSPIPVTEPEDIAAGRLEVYHLWVEAFNHDGKQTPMKGDRAILNHLLLGAQQLCFNNRTNGLIKAISKNALQQATRNRAGSPQKLKESFHASVGWFLNRRPPSRAALAKIQCSIRLIHCEDDIAYTLQYAEELEDVLRRAGIREVGMYEVPGPHYGNVVNPEAINPILLDHAISASSKSARRNAPLPRRHSLEPLKHKYEHHNCQKMVTPFTRRLARYGYDPHESEADSD